MVERDVRVGRRLIPQFERGSRDALVAVGARRHDATALVRQVPGFFLLVGRPLLAGDEVADPPAGGVVHHERQQSVLRRLVADQIGRWRGDEPRGGPGRGAEILDREEGIDAGHRRGNVPAFADFRDPEPQPTGAERFGEFNPPALSVTCTVGHPILRTLEPRPLVADPCQRRRGLGPGERVDLQFADGVLQKEAREQPRLAPADRIPLRMEIAHRRGIDRAGGVLTGTLPGAVAGKRCNREEDTAAQVLRRSILVAGPASRQRRDVAIPLGENPHEVEGGHARSPHLGEEHGPRGDGGVERGQPRPGGGRHGHVDPLGVGGGIGRIGSVGPEHLERAERGDHRSDLDRLLEGNQVVEPLPVHRLSRAVLPSHLACRPAHPGILGGRRAAEGVKQPRFVRRRRRAIMKHAALWQIDLIAANLCTEWFGRGRRRQGGPDGRDDRRRDRSQHQHKTASSHTVGRHGKSPSPGWARKTIPTEGSAYLLPAFDFRQSFRFLGIEAADPWPRVFNLWNRCRGHEHVKNSLLSRICG